MHVLDYCKYKQLGYFCKTIGNLLICYFDIHAVKSRSYIYFKLKILVLKNTIFISMDGGKTVHSVDVKFIFLRLVFEMSIFTCLYFAVN